MDENARQIRKRVEPKMTPRTLERHGDVLDKLRLGQTRHKYDIKEIYRYFPTLLIPQEPGQTQDGPNQQSDLCAAFPGKDEPK